MRRLMLTTVSIVALGLGSAGAASATRHAGMTGHMYPRSEIIQVQQKLQQDGLYNGKIDGTLGRETRHALREYQQQNGLRVTARLDRQTLDHLLGTPSGGQGSSTAPTANQPAGTAPAPSQPGATTSQPSK